MRMRNKKHARERLEAAGTYLIEEVEAFSPRLPLHIEIGCGKGTFITQTALANPQIQYLAVEKVSAVLVIAAERAATAEVPNLQFVWGDVERLVALPEKHSCERIYLNFSDPWPRRRNEKRRLTASGYLALYKELLTANGAVFMKTDNVGLFDYSLRSFAENGFEVRNVTRDLHHSTFAEGNIMTEYETLFSEQGVPICRLEAYLH